MVVRQCRLNRKQHMQFISCETTYTIENKLMWFWLKQHVSESKIHHVESRKIQEKPTV
jgi:hypothetical protein